MKILAIEFSTNHRGVALLDGPAWGSPTNSEIQVLAQQLATSPKDACAVELIEATLASAHTEREAVDGLAVSLGPGSYTGIRIAIALAQGWQLARPIQTVGISVIDCLAAQFAAERQGRFWVALDAQRGDFYLAGGETTPTGWRWSEPLRLASGDETRARLATGGTVIGPEIGRWFPAGWVLPPDAKMLGRLAWQNPQPVSAQQLEPIYQREISYAKAPPLRNIPVA
jgi:tRNA threonylcarbamoyladenosine biosynthesis protein TsaB